MSLDVELFVIVGEGKYERRLTLFEGNYTHNCNRMAAEAGIYDCVWRPDENENIQTAADLIEPLKVGIAQMEAEPERFIALNPKNASHGCYETFLPWLRSYLQACIDHPTASIEVDR